MSSHPGAEVTAPAIGMRLPRFSEIGIGQSRAVIPPQLTAVLVHLVLTTVPGSILVLLVVEPALGRTVVAVLVGFLSAVLLGLLGTAGPTGRAADAFQAVGEAIRAMPIGQARIVVGGGLLVAGIVVAVGCYRYAVGSFDRYTVT